MSKDEPTLGYSYHLPSGGFVLKIRNALAQFSDLFSEFNKYIAPAYHHDRCERSVQMRMYGMHKREFVLVFLGVFAMFGLATFIGLAGPPITLITEQKASSLIAKNNESELYRGPFVIKSPTMNTYNQQLWVIGQIMTDNMDDEIFDKSFHVSVETEGISSDRKPVKLTKGDALHNRTRHIRCKQSTCEEFLILHLGFLDYTRYVLTVRFYGLENFNQRYHIKEVEFYFKTYNPAFTQLEIWFRFIFLLTSFVLTCWFAHTLRRFPVQDWSIEQKWMSLLLPLLLLYNDPIFPLTFLVDYSLPGILDAIFQETFLSALLLFWLCAYHGLRQNERRFLTFYVPKLILVLPLWLSAVIFAASQRHSEWADPTFSYKINTEHFFSLKIVYLVVGSLYVLYLICLILRAYSELRSMPYFDVRLKLLTLMLIIIVSFMILLSTLKFGIGAIEDNFVAELNTTYKTSGEFMALYGILNFTIYAMAYVYTPSNSTPFESQITKDNPAFSMINDSDEDVIYGSDEDSRQPLNRSCNHDDSD